MEIGLNQVEIHYKDSGKRLRYHQTLSLAERGFTLLQGASGVGKSTLLHLLAGLISPCSGTVVGDDPSLHPSKIVMLFQEPRLLPWKRVSQQITSVCPKHTDPLPYLTSVGLEREGRLFPASLSGGMAKRVALARALAYGDQIQAQLYLLDEPFVGVEPQRVEALMELVSFLPVPVLVASHLPLVEERAESVISLVGEEEPSETYHKER